MLLAAAVITAAGFAAPASAAPGRPSVAAACSQSGYKNLPGLDTYAFRVLSDTCGRAIKGEARCEIEGGLFGDYYSWHYGRTVYAVGYTSTVLCGNNGLFVDRWGFETDIGGTWVYHQMGSN